MSNIKIIRLSSGEELISTVKYQSDEDDLNADTLLMLEDTAVLIPTQQNQLGLAPFMPYSDAVKRVALMGKDVMFVVDPVSELKQQYQEMFKKVVTPDKKIII